MTIETSWTSTRHFSIFYFVFFQRLIWLDFIFVFIKMPQQISSNDLTSSSAATMTTANKKKRKLIPTLSARQRRSASLLLTFTSNRVFVPGLRDTTNCYVLPINTLLFISKFLTSENIDVIAKCKCKSIIYVNKFHEFIRPAFAKRFRIERSNT